MDRETRHVRAGLGRGVDSVRGMAGASFPRFGQVGLCWPRGTAERGRVADRGAPRAFDLLHRLENSGDVLSYEGGSGPFMYYASTKARREAVQGG